MTQYTKELNHTDIKKLAKGCVSAKYHDGWVLEPKLGRVSFDLSNFKMIDELTIYTKRISGNGKFIAGINDNHTNFCVLSKIAQSFDLTTDGSLLEISRPTDSTGEICIFGLKVNYGIASEDTPLSYNWKSLISKCGKYNCLRMIGDRLFASEGAYIEQATIVKTVETAPPNMYFRDGDKLKFLGACEIVKLVVDGTYTAPPPDSKPYVHLDMPAPTLTTATEDAKPMQAFAAPSPNLTDKSITPPQMASNIAYDSDIMRGFDRFKFSNSINKNVKSVNSNGRDYLLIKRSGIATIPLSTLAGNREYVVSLNCKRLNGNGKLNVGISVGDGQPSYQQVLVDNGFFDKYVVLNTKNLPPDNLKLNIAMLEDSVGEILISRVLIVENIPRLTREDVIKDLEFAREPPLVLNYNYHDKHSIKFNTKQASLIFTEQYEPLETLPISKTIETLSLSSRRWVAKVAKMLPRLSVRDPYHVMQDFNKSSATPDLVMGSLGTLKVANRIFVEEWNSKTQPEASDLEILAKCNTIITPSLVNMQVLKNLLPNNNLVYLPRLWPISKGVKPIQESYLLYFEKDPKLTEFLIDCWQPNYTKLYVVGSTKGLPFNMQHISEYTPYHKLLEYVLGAKAVIELSDNTNYMSGIGMLAAENSVSLITNNLYYLAQDNYDIKFLNSKIVASGVELDKLQIRLTVEAAMTQDPKTQEFNTSYLNSLSQNLNNMFGIQC